MRLRIVPGTGGTGQGITVDSDTSVGATRCLTGTGMVTGIGPGRAGGATPVALVSFMRFSSESSLTTVSSTGGVPGLTSVTGPDVDDVDFCLRSREGRFCLFLLEVVGLVLADFTLAMGDRRYCGSTMGTGGIVLGSGENNAGSSRRETILPLGVLVVPNLTTKSKSSSLPDPVARRR